MPVPLVRRRHWLINKLNVARQKANNAHTVSMKELQSIKCHDRNHQQQPQSKPVEGVAAVARSPERGREVGMSYKKGLPLLALKTTCALTQNILCPSWLAADEPQAMPQGAQKGQRGGGVEVATALGPGSSSETRLLPNKLRQQTKPL